jgi:hypothetical protein
MIVNHDLLGGIFQIRSPQEIVQAYHTGKMMGAFLADPAMDNLPSHIRAFARYQHDQARDEIGRSHFNFETAKKYGAWGAGAWKGQRAFLWKAWIILDQKKALRGAQLTGDCTSWGERCKQETRRAVEIVTDGVPEKYVARQATCLIYSGRGHTGQGASPIGIANWAVKCGILPEGTFTDANGKVWDFSDYNAYVNYGIKYGATGMPQSIIQITKKAHVVSQSLVTTTDALFDLLLRGYPTSVGFSRATASTGNPVSRFQGSTSHETCFIGFDDTDVGREMVKQSLGYEDTAVMLDQSWGNWNRLTNVPQEWQPISEGMYVHSARDAQLLLNERAAMACTGGIDGFAADPIDNRLL